MATVPDSVRITYVGNEGFLIEVEGRNVLIDALYRMGVAGYVVHPPDLRRQLEKAQPPFDDIEVVLATHYHADHFDPQSVGTYLINNRSARFISTDQSVTELQDGFPAWRHISERVTASHPDENETEIIELDGIRITVLNLHHGRSRPVQNLGFIVEIDGRTFLHIGDTEVTPAEFGSLGLAELDIDFFFVPYWFLTNPRWNDQMEPAVGSPTFIAMHMPPKDDPKGYMADSGGFDGTVAKIRSTYPEVVVFEEPMSIKIFD